MGVTEILSEIKTAYEEILKDNLTGIYVHGSIAFGCFNREKSDIDFLVVVKHAPSLEEKKALIRVLLRLDSNCPPKGLEMSVVLEEVCRSFQYPTPFELHFSNGHKAKCIRDLEKYCMEMKGVDKDLAAHFTVVRKVGLTLCGRSINQVFGEVPREDYIDSIKFDIEDTIHDIQTNPVYIILNLCRVLAYLKEGVVLSKEQGGDWGTANLPREYSDIAAAAKNSYCKDIPFAIEEKSNHSFADYMLKLIDTE